MTDRGLTLSAESINGLLSSADSQARRLDLAYADTEWIRRINELKAKGCPRTYLGVLGVTLVARGLHSREELNVLHIQQKTSRFGYSAPSIGGKLVPFAVEQGIDLRSTSSQIMNNQPFTFQAEIRPGMSVESKATYFAQFFDSVCRVNDLTSHEAKDVLSLLFAMCRKADVEETPELEVRGGLEVRDKVLAATDEFVRTNSERGRVGQALMAAIFDLQFGADNVELGHVSDPDVSTPGDVIVKRNGATFLWGESKQKPVTTGDVETFVSKVSKVGGGRMCFCAFENYRYERHIDFLKISRLAVRNQIEIEVCSSPQEFLSARLNHFPGGFDHQSSALVNRFIVRLKESQVVDDLVDDYSAIISSILRR